jgi:hypothetical protein
LLLLLLLHCLLLLLLHCLLLLLLLLLLHSLLPRLLLDRHFPRSWLLLPLYQTLGRCLGSLRRRPTSIGRHCNLDASDLCARQLSECSGYALHFFKLNACTRNPSRVVLDQLQPFDCAHALAMRPQCLPRHGRINPRNHDGIRLESGFFRRRDHEEALAELQLSCTRLFGPDCFQHVCERLFPHLDAHKEGGGQQQNNPVSTLQLPCAYYLST